MVHLKLPWSKTICDSSKKSTLLVLSCLRTRPWFGLCVTHVACIMFQTLYLSPHSSLSLGVLFWHLPPLISRDGNPQLPFQPFALARGTQPELSLPEHSGDVCWE